MPSLFRRRSRHPLPTGRPSPTRSARTTLSRDLQQTQPLQDPLPDTSGPVALLGLRASVTAGDRTRRPARRLGRRVRRVEIVRRRRSAALEGVRGRLDAGRTQARLAAAAAHDRSAARLGHLSVWISTLPVYALAFGMVLNDPVFVLMTLREAFDIPLSTGALDVRNPDVLVAVAGAFVVTTVLVAASHVTGNALATLLFRPHLARAGTDEGDSRGAFPGIAEHQRLMGTVPAAIIATIGIVPMFWFMVLLHHFAVARFEADIAASITGGGARTWVVWSITMLPLVVLAFQTLACAPQVEFARKASGWSRRYRLRERLDIAADQRRISLEHRRRTRADWSLAVLADVLRDIAHRTDHEAYRARNETGAVDVSAVEQAWRFPADPLPSGVPAVEATGRVAGRFLPGLDDVPNRVRCAVKAWRRLPPVPQASEAACLWRQARTRAEQAAGISAGTTGTGRLVRLDLTGTERVPAARNGADRVTDLDVVSSREQS